MKRIKLKSEYDVFGSKWKIVYKKNLFDGETKIDGLTVYREKTIYIEKNIDHRRKFETFIHEIMHAVIDETGIDQMDISMDAEQAICENFSRQIGRLIFDE